MCIKLWLSVCKLFAPVRQLRGPKSKDFLEKHWVSLINPHSEDDDAGK